MLGLSFAQAAEASGTLNINRRIFKPEHVSALITDVLNFLLSIAGIIAVIMIIVSGLKMVSSAGNTDAVENAKKGLTAAVIGLIIVVMSKIIVSLFVKFVSGTS